MRRAPAFCCVVILVFGGSGAVPAQERVHTESKTKQAGPGPNVVTKTETVTGVVRAYQAGKKIEIAGPNDKRYSFDLDGGARIDGPVTVGQMARVDWVKRDGRERVTVIAPYGVGIRSSAGEPRKPGSTMRAESTKRIRQPGPDVKTTSGVVVGTVKAYRAGRTLTVNGPYGQDYAFDLAGGIAIPGGVTVGRKVRIEYRKSADGNQITAIALVPAGAR